MEIKLSKATVKIKDALTWGDAQKIQAAVMSGAKMNSDESKKTKFDFDTSGILEAKYVALECAVLEIKEGETAKIFSREWMDNLTEEDGDKLYEAVNGLSKKKEK